MIFIALDFIKAYDSISKSKLIDTLVEFKINAKMIEMEAVMYNKDSTVVKLGKMEEKFEQMTKKRKQN